MAMTSAADDYRGPSEGKVRQMLSDHVEAAVRRRKGMIHEIVELLDLEGDIIWEFLAWYRRLETRARCEQEIGNLIASGGNGGGDGSRDLTPTQGSHYNTDRLLQRIMVGPDEACDAVDVMDHLRETGEEPKGIVQRLRERLNADRGMRN